MNLNNYTVIENIDTSFIGYLKVFLHKIIEHCKNTRDTRVLSMYCLLKI